VLSGKDLCDGPITRREDSYRLSCVIMYNPESQELGGPGPCRAVGTDERILKNIVTQFVRLVIMHIYKK
jgi:hypothetical protein